jgi:hypothetical protein
LKLDGSVASDRASSNDDKVQELCLLLLADAIQTACLKGIQDAISYAPGICGKLEGKKAGIPFKEFKKLQFSIPFTPRVLLIAPTPMTN